MADYDNAMQKASRLDIRITFTGVLRRDIRHDPAVVTSRWTLAA